MIKSSWKSLRLALGVSVLSAAAVLCTTPAAQAATSNGTENYPVLGSDGSTGFYTVWESGSHGIYGSLSTDNGVTWQPAQLLAEGRDHWTAQYRVQPNAVTYSNGAWLVYYREFNVTMDIFSIYDMVIRSTDGVNWSAPQELDGVIYMLSGIYGLPPIQMSYGDMESDGTGTVVATAGVFGQVARSTDGGLTWTKSQLPSSAISIYGRSRFNVTYAGNQAWHIAFSGEKNPVWPNPGLFSNFYTSTDNGTTFTVRDMMSTFESVNDMVANGSTVVTMADNKFLYSTDSGQTWSGTNTEIIMAKNSLELTDGGMWVAATDWSLYRTTDPAAGWTPLATPPLSQGTADWPDLASNGARVGIVRSHLPAPAGSPMVRQIIFQYSDDYGITWSTANAVSEAAPAAAGDWQLFQ